ncbi:hypothetical protein PSE_0747 [Pseudovibrio sp. FO-BEG1]|nr:hypothetical protein PSE_0747 [Pseudovibrio sp. FO-BEG1]
MIRKWKEQVIDMAGLTPSEFMVASVLADFFNAETGCAFPTQPTLASKSKRSLPVVKRCIRKLKAGGFIKPIEVINQVGTKRYLCCFPKPQTGVYTDTNLGPSRPYPRVCGDLLKTYKSKAKDNAQTRPAEFTANLQRLAKIDNLYFIEENDPFWSQRIHTLPVELQPELRQGRDCKSVWVATENDLAVVYNHQRQAT